MGPDYDNLHPHLKVAHEAPLSATGKVVVEGAERAIAKVIARMLNLPRAGGQVALEVQVTHSSDGQVWSRKFGHQQFSTQQSVRNGLMREVNGPGCIEIEMSREGQDLVYQSQCARWAGLKLPRYISPQIIARVTPTEQGWTAKVEISMPLAGRLCTYTAEITQWT